MTEAPRRKLTFHPGIEGLRGLLVAVILLFHDGYEFAQGGFLTVSTFFTLSGFLITGLLLDEQARTGRIDLAAFWSHRFRRLMPAALLSLLGIAVFSALFADPFQLERLRGDGMAAVFYAANWWLIATNAGYADLLGSPSPIQHFWSLAIEEQYYLLYPPLAAAILAVSAGSRRWLGSVLATLTLASLAWTYWLAGTDAPNTRLYFGTDTRASELIAGALLAIATYGRSMFDTRTARSMVNALGVAALLAAAWFWTSASFDATSLYRGGIASYTIVSIALLAAATSPSGPVRWLLDQTWLRWLGRISYGIYLYHWPIYLWVNEQSVGVSGLSLSVLRVALSVAVAEASYRWFEYPIRRGTMILGWRRWAAAPLAIGCVVAAFVIVGPPAPMLNQSSTAMAPAQNAHTILVLGDSVADAIGRGMIVWAAETGAATVVNRSRPGCGFARAARPGDPTRTQTRCDNWKLGIGWQVMRHRPDVVLVYTSAWDVVERELPAWGGPRSIGDPDYDAWLISEYEAALEMFRLSGAHVAWLSPLCLTNRTGPQTGAFDPEVIRALDETIIEPLAHAHPGEVTYVDLFAAVCPDGLFTDDFGGLRNARPDGIHFSPAGERWVGYWLGNRMIDLARRPMNQDRPTHR